MERDCLTYHCGGRPADSEAIVARRFSSASLAAARSALSFHAKPVSAPTAAAVAGGAGGKTLSAADDH